MSDVMMPIFAAVMVIMGFVGGCDRWRLSEVEKDCREHRSRILQLEIDMQILKERQKDAQREFEQQMKDVKRELDWRKSLLVRGGAE